MTRTQVDYEDESGVALLTKHEVLVPRVGDRIAVTPASGETVHGTVGSVHWTVRREYTVATVVVERDASDYVPAVRRVVGYNGGKGPRWVGKARAWAYWDAANRLVGLSCARMGLRVTWEEYHEHWPRERVQRLADYLQRRDEEAGY